MNISKKGSAVGPLRQTSQGSCGPNGDEAAQQKETFKKEVKN